MRSLDLFGERPPSASEDVARLRFELRDRSLLELRTIGALEWDEADRQVRKGRRFDELWDELRS